VTAAPIEAPGGPERARVTISRPRPGVALVRAVGSFDLATVSVLRSALGAAVGNGADIVLDMGCVEFIDATGLGAVVEADGAAGRLGHTLRIVNAKPKIVQLLEIVQLRGLLGAG